MNTRAPEPRRAKVQPVSPTPMTATVLFLELGLHPEVIHVEVVKEQLFLGDSLFQLEVTGGRFLNDLVSRLPQAHYCAPCCCCCCCSCGHCCGCCCCVAWQVQHCVQSVFTALFVLSFSSFFFSISPPLSLRQSSGSLRPYHHHEPVWLPSGCSPDSSTASRRPQYVVRCPHGSTVRFFHPRHVSIRHISLVMQ